MNKLTEAMDLIKQLVDYVQSAPAAILIIIALNGIGLLLKKSLLPNQLIPWVVVFVGVALTVALAPIPSGRNPMTLLAVMGFIFGLIAWLAHNLILWRLEKFLPAGFLPGDGSKTNNQTPTDPPV